MLGTCASRILFVEGDAVEKFLSRLEDEINNPLLAISATIEMLVKVGSGLDSETLARLQVIETSAQRIQKAVSSLSQAVREQ